LIHVKKIPTDFLEIFVTRYEKTNHFPKISQNELPLTMHRVALELQFAVLNLIKERHVGEL